MSNAIRKATIGTLSIMALASMAPSPSSIMISGQFGFCNTHNSFVVDYADYEFGTDSIIPKELELPLINSYEEAVALFGGDIVFFSKEEEERYIKSVKKLFHPLGVNIFDLCLKNS